MPSLQGSVTMNSDSTLAKTMDMTSWESLLLGVLLLLVMFWMWPGIKQSMEMSKQAESDWGGLLVPIGFVVMFVIFLIMMV